jgi:2'-5' RNA ligase
LRLFVALDLPDDVSLPTPDPPWRPVPRGNQHVTLAFLGSPAVPPEFDEPPPAAPLVMDAPVLLPPRRPRVLAVRLSDPTGAHTAHQARLARRLAEAGVYEPEDRPWLPHVTIGRTRERVSRNTPLPEVTAQTFMPPSMTLYHSAGGRYVPLVTLSARS